ncbi:MAG: hypothetical protein K8J08_18420 [Thermoanaerobaculia bacterium]|nr:hypothetical protein [Thermoanaerobaculia bacterium]
MIENQLPTPVTKTALEPTGRRSWLGNPQGLCLLILVVILSPASQMHAQTNLTVDTVLDDPDASACSDEVPDDCSLRGAITLANGIALPEEVFIELFVADFPLTVNGPGEDANQTGDLDILRSLTLRGFHTVLSDIDGGGAGGLDDRLLEVHGVGTTVTLEDLTLEDSVPPADLHAVNVGAGAALRMVRVYIESSGSLADGGGGLRVEPGGSASLHNSRIWYNAGFQGAGILTREGPLFLLDSIVRNNVAVERGGGVAILDDLGGDPQIVSIQDSYLFNNISGDGGGVWAGTGTELHLIGDFLEGNRVTIGPSRRGGAVYSQGRVLVQDTTITGGEANAGVALYLEDGGIGTPQLDLVNSTISGVSTDQNIAALHLLQTTTELLAVTMKDNAFDVYVSQSAFQVSYSLFEGGCLPVLGTLVSSDGGNLGLDATCWNSLPGGGLTVPSLGLGSLGGGTVPVHLPSSVSPAVDNIAGPCLPTDQRAYSRPASLCDSGAVERLPLEAIFLADFEGGDTGEWSVAAP